MKFSDYPLAVSAALARQVFAEELTATKRAQIRHCSELTGVKAIPEQIANQHHPKLGAWRAATGPREFPREGLLSCRDAFVSALNAQGRCGGRLRRSNDDRLPQRVYSAEMAMTRQVLSEPLGEAAGVKPKSMAEHFRLR